jgi:sugar/nucleoside kinase (ribokinase family)
VVVEQGVNSQFSFVVVDQATGKRTILWTNAGLKLLPEELRREEIVSGKVLLVDAHFAQAATLAATWANEDGIPVVMDAGSVREGHEELMLHVDYLITSETFARTYTGMDDPREAAQSMFTGRRTLSAVTLNERGCIWATKEGIFHEPAFSVEAVDTTGAGDVFHGAFAYALALGWQIEQCIRFASAVAAIKCTKLGGRAGIPTKQETLNFIMDQGKSV